LEPLEKKSDWSTLPGCPRKQKVKILTSLRVAGPLRTRITMSRRMYHIRLASDGEAGGRVGPAQKAWNVRREAKEFVGPGE